MVRSRHSSSKLGAPDALEHISEVLAAEARLRQSVESCREALNREIAEAQEWARALQRRTHARLTRLHTACDRRIHSGIADLQARVEQEAPRIDLDPADHDALARAVEQLVDQLIGRDHG